MLRPYAYMRICQCAHTVNMSKWTMTTILKAVFMRIKKLLTATIVIMALFIIPSITNATPSADIVYNETNLGGGQWQYEYIFYNNSTEGESLYSVWLDFSQTATLTGSILMTGWNGNPWGGTHITDSINTFSTSPVYDIAAGYSFGGFDFKIDYRAGDVPFTAYFDNGSGISSVIDNTAAVPEPVSSTLFAIGGAVLGFRRFKKE